MKKFKMFFIRFLVVLLAGQGAVAAQLLTLPTVHAGTTSTPEVVINEAMWMGSSTSTADEWLELYNPGDTDVVLDGWTLTGLATSGADLVIPTGHTIKAKSYFLISYYLNTDSKTILDIKPDWVTTSISLVDMCKVGTNIYTQLENADVVPVIIDQVGCLSNGGPLPTGLETPLHQSMERNLDFADGMISTSWHTSFGSINLKTGVTDLATPGFINDNTAPDVSKAVVNDGPTVGTDIDWSADTANVSANWDGFVDPESDLSGDYMVGVGTGSFLDNVVAYQKVTGKIHTFSGLVLAEGMKYFVSVKAINKVGLVSNPRSNDGFTIDTQNPATPTLTVIDTPNDNGGSVLANYSTTSLDDITYELRYKKSADPDLAGSWTTLPATTATSVTIKGLENGIDYDFEVVAIDFNNQRSAKATVVAQALDNLAPILNKDKVTIEQNRPGVADLVYGLAGAVSEPSHVNVLDSDSKLIGTTNSDPDGSFTKIDLGDNKYGTFKIQLVDLDASAPVGEPVVFSNDIVAPTAPTLTKLTSDCDNEETCRVVLNWKDNGPDTDHYQVGYTATGEVEKRTFDLTTTSVTLDLANGKSYDFVVYAFDKSFNVSAKSNVIFHALARGVNTVITLVDGQLVTESSAVSGSTAVSEQPLPQSNTPLEFTAPKVKAAEPGADTTTGTSTPTTETKAAKQDWLRIFVVVILLLIVASGFYALSRSFKDTGELENQPPETPPATKPKSKNGSSNTKKRPKRRPRRRT